MKFRQIIAVAFAVLGALPPASAQSPAPEANPGAPAGTPTREVTRPPTRVNRDAAADVDARHCLEASTNLEVIKCAEKYRLHKRRG